MAAHSYDIVIVGGGLVGASLAAALAGSRYRILLVEAFAPDSAAQPSFDERTTALGNASRRILEALSLWPQLAPEAAPIQRIHVSDAGRPGMAVVDAASLQLEALGHVVPNRALGRALWASLAKATNIVCCVPARVGSVTIGADAARLSIDNGGQTLEVSAQLVLAADGAQSAVRAAAGIAVRVEDYGQHAIVASLRLEEANDGTAYERFTAVGPMALLPIVAGGAPGWRTLVWATSPEAAQRLLSLPADAFLREWQQAFGWRAGRARQLGPRAAYPLQLSRAERSVAPRVALLGNAAQAQHPVAGQGFNLGLRDAAELAELLASHAGDPGDAQLLARFEGLRREDRRGVVQFTDSLVRLFSDERKSVAGLRGAGLLLFDLLPPAKRFLGRVSLGFGPRSPRLARGLSLLP